MRILGIVIISNVFCLGWFRSVPSYVLSFSFLEFRDLLLVASVYKDFGWPLACGRLFPFYLREDGRTFEFHITRRD